jgi:hypothetical protein
VSTVNGAGSRRETVARRVFVAAVGWLRSAPSRKTTILLVNVGLSPVLLIASCLAKSTNSRFIQYHLWNSRELSAGARGGRTEDTIRFYSIVSDRTTKLIEKPTTVTDTRKRNREIPDALIAQSGAW